VYKNFYNENKYRFDIFIIYILEAHFVEKNESGKIIGGWPIGSQYNYPQHKTLDDRIHMAKILENEFQLNIPILLDHIDNDFQNYHKVWPDGVIVYDKGALIYESKVDRNGIREKIWTDEFLDIFDNK